MADKYDAVVVGAGPNGLAAAISLIRAGLSVLVIEANDDIGGAARSAELMQSGVVHDLGSAVHPMGVASPFFQTTPLADFGLEWVHPGVPLAHPLDGGNAGVQYRSIDATMISCGTDGPQYRRLFEPFAERWQDFMEDALLPPVHIPTHPLLLARFGWKALLPASIFSSMWFSEERARALFMGIAAHTNYSLKAPLSSAIGIVLGSLSHAVGWPVPRGGAQAIPDAMVTYFEHLGGQVETGREVRTLEELPSAEIVMLNLTPRQVVKVAGPQLPPRYVRKLQSFEYGPGAYKLDYILNGPIPWENEFCRQAGTVHLGGTSTEIVAAEEAVHQGRLAERPFVLVTQPSLFDDSRAPEGVHTAWMYAHVPAGYTGDYTATIERQVERFAPGFRDCIEERFVSTPAVLEAQNANLVDGDISGGTMSPQQIIARPTLSLTPYRTPTDGLYICSSSTPPGGGVHGMCGYNAAQLALRDLGLSDTFEAADVM